MVQGKRRQEREMEFRKGRKKVHGIRKGQEVANEVRKRRGVVKGVGKGRENYETGEIRGMVETAKRKERGRTWER